MKVEKILKKIYKKRKREVHKYDFGSLLVVGGSKLYSGSPAFNALAALRAGVDLVTIAAPERAADIIASFSPDLITYPLKGGYLNKKHLKELFELTKNKTAIVIGGGLGRKKETLLAVVEFLKNVDIPSVIDADAIHALTLNKKIIENKKFVITPHAYEFYVLSGEKVSKDLKKNIALVKRVASELKTIILLKGNVDIISNGKEVALNKSGSPYLTKGGTGDTLAGVCGALLARGASCFEAAYCSAYINGKAGELASKKYREGLLASDLLEEIPKVIKS